jgi:HEAT repeat protein
MRIAACLLLLTCAVRAQGQAGDFLRWAVQNKPQDANSIEKAAKYLDSIPEVREAAIRALVAIGPKAFPHVLPYVHKKKPTECRRAAARTLGALARQMDEVPDDKDLFKAIRDKDETVRENVGPAVAKAGSKGVRLLLGLSGSSDRDTRMLAARSLATLGKAAVPDVTGNLANRSARRRESAAVALGLIGTDAEYSARALIKAMDDESEDVRAAAARAVARVAPKKKDVTARLVQGLRDPAPAVAAACAEGLASFGPEALPPILDALPKLNEEGYAAVARSIVAFDEPAIRPLEAATSSKEAKVRRVAATCLGRLGRKHGYSSIGDALKPLLADPDPTVRIAAALALGRVDRQVGLLAEAALLKALEDKAPAVRAAVLSALGDIAPPGDAVRRAVKRWTMDPDRRVAAAAHYAAWRTGGPFEPALAALRGNLTDEGLEPASRIHAALALGRFGQAADAAIPELAKVLEREQERTDVRAAAAQALGELLVTRKHPFALRRERVAKAPREVRRAVAAALKWLAKNQLADGTWSSTIEARHGREDYKRGVSALAVLTFLAAGYTDRGDDNPYRDTVRRGLAYLASRQDQAGALGLHHHDYVAMHALCTQALCEAMLMTGDQAYKPVIWKALGFIEHARNPYMAWRYEPRGGENDTRHAAVMATTLRIGGLCGYDVDPTSLEGPRQWIDKMTDPNFGQVGYNYPGGVPFRGKGIHENFPPEKSQAMTAAGIWTRIVLGEDPRESLMIRKGANLCIEVAPDWNPDDGSVDLYYWYWGTLAMHEIGGAPWRKWETALGPALLHHQSSKGSWPADTAWGMLAGRVYTTSFATLTLLTPYRYEPGFWEPGRLMAPYDDAAEALREAADADEGLVREAAREALATSDLR